jgi:predicted site-specific integrase-resolvase
MQLGLHANTLRKYADAGAIKTIRTPSGQRRYDVDSFVGKAGSAAIICYARVSSAKQRDDLQRQKSHLESIYPGAEIIADVGSGINFKRRGLKTILERAIGGDKLTVVVAHKDRLARFGFDLIEWIINRNGGEVVVLSRDKFSPGQELTTDLLTILHVFSCRMHGLRKYSKQIEEDKNLSEPGTEAHPR